MKFALRIPAMLAVSALFASSAQAQAPGGGMSGGGAPVEVGYIVMQPETAPITTVLPGRVVASATAEVRPQVGGIVTSVNFREGQPLKAGDLLVTVDSDSYEAQLAVAEASLESAKSQLPTAQATVTRYETLVASGGISQSELDTARAALAQAQANVAQAEAQLRVAQITLNNTRIVAPIAGIAGTVDVEVGSLLTASQTDALTTIRQVDPVKITLVESSANLLSFNRNMPQGEEEPTDFVPPTVTLELEDGTTYNQSGTISGADFVVSETTGTFTSYAMMPNPNRKLLPGMFVRATVKLGDEENVFLVPQRAVTFNDDGQPTAFFVSEDNKAEQRVLEADRVINNAWVVTSGIEANDKLIVDGFQNFDAGSDVNPVEVTIQDDGVILQQLPTGQSETPAQPEANP